MTTLSTSIPSATPTSHDAPPPPVRLPDDALAAGFLAVCMAVGAVLSLIRWDIVPFALSTLGGSLIALAFMLWRGKSDKQPADVTADDAIDGWHRAQDENRRSLTPPVGFTITRRPPIFTPRTVSCAHGCGHSDVPSAMGYDPFLGHVCRQGCRRPQEVA